MRAMKLVALILLLCFAQNGAVNNSTAIGPNARYQIVQSSLTARDTYRVDTYLGIVCVLTENSVGEFGWSEIRRFPHPQNRITRQDKVNFQMFVSGIIARATFLINIDTGATWVITKETKTGDLYLVAMD